MGSIREVSLIFDTVGTYKCYTNKGKFVEI